MTALQDARDAPAPARAWAARRPLRRRRGFRVAGLLALGGAVVGAVVIVLVSGASFFIVESPSMGRAAPVGSLVVTTRVPFGDLRVGDVVTYRADRAAATTTHRVVGIGAAGITMRGDINGAADAAVVRPAMVVGRAIAIVPALGRVLRLVPWVVVGVLSVWLLTWPLRGGELRSALRIVGSSTVCTVLLLLQHPLVDWVVLEQRPVARALLMRIVATGLLPLQFRADGGEGVALIPGEVGALRVPSDAGGRIRLDIGLALAPWGWVLLLLVCLAPLLTVLIVGLPPRDGELERPG